MELVSVLRDTMGQLAAIGVSAPIMAALLIGVLWALILFVVGE